MAQVRITDSAGVERDTIPLVSLAKEQLGLNTETLARVTVNRGDLNSISGLKPGEDRVYIEDASGVGVFGGVLRTPGRSGGRPIMLVDSFSEYMKRAQPVPLGQQKVAASDSTLIRECIDATPQLSAGTIETVESGQTWIFSGISQLAKARKVAEASGGELVFNPNLTVDYLAQRGSDKTATTLSPANGNFVENTFNADQDGISGNTTHLKVYGVGQGTSQVEATVVPDADSGSYANKVTYSHPTWSAGDDEIWDARTNKDLKNVSALQSWGENLIADLQEEELRVETVVKGEPVELGDRFRVSHPEEGVDDTLRAVELTTLRGSDGVRYEVVFSNYDVAHVDQLAEDHKDTGRYNQAFEGDLTNVQQSPGRGPVGPNHDYFIYVYYPDDVVAEVNAQLLVKGTNYRAYVAGAASGGGATSGANSPFSEAVFTSGSTGTVSGDGTTKTLDSFSTTTTTQEMNVTFSLDATAGGAGSAVNTVRVRNTATGDVWENVARFKYGSDGVDATAVTVTVPIDVGTGDTFDAEIDTASGVDYIGTIVWQGVGDHTHATPDHTHAPDPGILDWDGAEQSPQHYPENVDVLVNGVSQGTSLGDGTSEFEERVDLGTELTTGWNTIRLTSTGLGHLDATFSADLFRQSL